MSTRRRIETSKDGKTISTVFEEKALGVKWREVDRDSMSLGRFVEALLNRRTNNIGDKKFLPMLPEHMRGRTLFVSGEEEEEIVAVEIEPRMAPLIYSDNVYKVAVPWMVYVISFEDESTYVYYRNSQMENLSDPVYLTNLPNTFEGGAGTCTSFPPMDNLKSLSERVGEVISSFWTTEFNNDLNNNWNKARSIDKHPKSFEQWQTMSNLNPEFILTIPWLGKTTLLNAHDWCASDDLTQEGFRDLASRIIQFN